MQACHSLQSRGRRRQFLPEALLRQRLWRSLASVQLLFIVTAGKDKLVKYWDADKFEQLLELPGHQGPVWGLAVSHLGDLVVSCGGDRAIRR
jgi:WD40 repeat protein